MAHYKPIIVRLSVITTLGLLITLLRNINTCVIIFAILIVLCLCAFTLPTIISFLQLIGQQGFMVKLLAEVVARKPTVKGKE